MKKTLQTRRMALMAMYVAIAYLLMIVGRLPISSVDFLIYEPKDIVLVICGFTMGTLPAVLVTALVALLEMLTASTTGPIGFLMNFLASAAFVCPASLLYNRRRTMRSAALGLILGTLAMTAIMLLWNYLVTPAYMGTPREVIGEMLLPIFLPFNLIKGGLNTAITIIVYKPLSRAIRAAKLLPEDVPTKSTPTQTRHALKVFAIITLLVCVLSILAIRGII